MTDTISANINERQAEAAFTTQSVMFDELYSGNTIVDYKRDRVRSHVLKYLPPNSSILELNSGTGQDAHQHGPADDHQRLTERRDDALGRGPDLTHQ